MHTCIHHPLIYYVHTERERERGGGKKKNKQTGKQADKQASKWCSGQRSHFHLFFLLWDFVLEAAKSEKEETTF